MSLTQLTPQQRRDLELGFTTPQQKRNFKLVIAALIVIPLFAVISALTHSQYVTDGAPLCHDAQVLIDEARYIERYPYRISPHRPDRTGSPLDQALYSGDCTQALAKRKIVAVRQEFDVPLLGERQRMSCVSMTEEKSCQWTWAWKIER
jgi:hypothetical protein